MELTGLVDRIYYAAFVAEAMKKHIKKNKQVFEIRQTASSEFNPIGDTQTKLSEFLPLRKVFPSCYTVNQGEENAAKSVNDKGRGVRYPPKGP